MSTDDFYSDQREHSEIKSLIVEKYFTAWASIILMYLKKINSKNSKLFYIDLFSGPGKYDSGTESTPIKILRSIVKNHEFNEKMFTFFNDKNPDYIEQLKNNIENLDIYAILKNKPQFFNEEVDFEVVNSLREQELPPSLIFIDPFGYKGVSLELIESATKDFGCDCIVFFNFNRVRMHITNPLVEGHIKQLFSGACFQQLMQNYSNLDADDKEATIVECFSKSIKEKNINYILPFRFVDIKGTKTSHYLVFVSKHLKGYEKMKDVMSQFSELENSGVPLFCYNPVNKNFPIQYSLFAKIDELESSLLESFSGQTITTIDIYHKHNVGTPFTLKNYKAALKNLLSEKKIATDRTPKKGTFADDIEITFP